MQTITEIVKNTKKNSPPLKIILHNTENTKEHGR